MLSSLRRVAVIGTGLIGGSLAASLRAARPSLEVVGWSPGADAARAGELGLLSHAAPSLAQAVSRAELVVLAAPVDALPALMREVFEFAPREVVVTDCGSTKSGVVAAAQALGPVARRFVAGHPIAGGEQHGPQAARAGLFQGALAVLCPLPETDALALELVRELWTAVGAQVVDLPAGEHDAVFAEVSHWPHAVAFALCGAIASGPQAEPALRFAGAGLRDTTRIGASSSKLWADILLQNRERVLDSAARFQLELAGLLNELRATDREALTRRLEAASRWRQRLVRRPDAS